MPDNNTFLTSRKLNSAEIMTLWNFLIASFSCQAMGIFSFYYMFQSILFLKLNGLFYSNKNESQKKSTLGKIIEKKLFVDDDTIKYKLQIEFICNHYGTEYYIKRKGEIISEKFGDLKQIGDSITIEYLFHNYKFFPCKCCNLQRNLRDKMPVFYVKNEDIDQVKELQLNDDKRSTEKCLKWTGLG
eukprot:264557_1